MNAQEETVYAMKSVIENLFGKKAWQEIKECDSLGTWKKYSLRILDAVKLSSETTIKVADSDYQSELLEMIQFRCRQIRDVETFEELFAILAAGLAMVCFHQIGYYPIRSGFENVPLRSSHWKLDIFRTVQYVQTTEQKSDQREHRNRLRNRGR
jgi:hypothetical protein